jgi:predicted metal-binding membrane protein
MSGAAPFDRVLRRDRIVAVAALAAVCVLAWGYVLLGAGMDMSAAMAGAATPMPVAWTPGHAAVMALMWALMMLAMMLPSAAPMILLHATVSRRRDPGRAAGTRGAAAGAPSCSRSPTPRSGAGSRWRPRPRSGRWSARPC